MIGEADLTLGMLHMLNKYSIFPLSLRILWLHRHSCPVTNKATEPHTEIPIKQLDYLKAACIALTLALPETTTSAC